LRALQAADQGLAIGIRIDHRQDTQIGEVRRTLVLAVCARLSTLTRVPFIVGLDPFTGCPM
jgi:hypothetical protein